MADLFDPSDFDDPPPKATPASDPGAEYRSLLDAMRKAGAEGVAQQTAALSQQIAQDAKQRAAWAKQMGAAISEVERSATRLQQISAGVWWDRLKEWLATALIGLGVIGAAALAYRWAQEPKIEKLPYGCSAGWNAKTQHCKGTWVPLSSDNPQ